MASQAHYGPIPPSYQVHPGHDLPQVADEDNYPEVVPQEHYPEVTTADAVKHNVPYPVDQKADLNPVSEGPVGNGVERRVLGLKRRTFFIVLAVALLVVIAAVVGGAVGGTVNKSKNSAAQNSSNGTSTSPSSNATTTSTDLMLNSSIAAANWTDTAGYVHYAIFSQSTTAAILTSVWDSQNETWTTIDIFAAIQTTENYVLTAKAGTPIAVAAKALGGVSIAVYYLAPNNQIQALDCLDTQGLSNWTRGKVNDASIVAGANSQIAAMWYICDVGCGAGNLMVTYEDASGVLTAANSSGWTTSTIVTVIDGSGLAMTPQVAGASTTGYANYTQMRIFADISNDLQEYTYSPTANSGQWTLGENVSSNTSTVAHQIAAVAFAPLSFVLAYCLFILRSPKGDGGITADYWNGSAWSSDFTPSMSGPDGITATSNFTSIAMNDDFQVFGYINGSVHTWNYTSSDPTTWSYVGLVNTTLSA
ncbi:hypothetical protein BP5796_02844 [Coleophoma crateriformis]|uniref:Fucose-specific lectin n=1 Tax=Coleophoma crateriformis TaxID=565419 RepID=A0A3D8SZK9_9HELO|nr:hypothetical protein BP5796_02844 [Coleophoma crateriformis]